MSIEFPQTDSAGLAASDMVVAMPAELTRDWVQGNQHMLRRKPSSPLTLDFALTERVDSTGLALVWQLGDSYRRAGQALTLRNVPVRIRPMIEQWRCPAAAVTAPRAEPGFLLSLGDAGTFFARQLVDALSMLVEMLYWSSFGLRRRRDFRKGVLGSQMYHLGYKATGIVALLAFLIGIVLALQSAMFLKAYGAGVFLAGMVGWSMIREFGPLMTAVILAGRTGSATTAEIATMQVGEEIDALRTMGINPVQFVVVPKLWAITLTMPVLSFLSSAIGIFGAFLVSLLYLDISPGLFWNQLCAGMRFRDFGAGFLKSVVFSWLIIWVGAYFGFRVRGGAEEVGRETTASVVAAIFVIVLADAFFSFVLP